VEGTAEADTSAPGQPDAPQENPQQGKPS